MDKNDITKDNIDEVLFRFLQSIYLFEKREADLFNITWDQVYLLQLLKRKPGLPVSETAKLLKVPDFIASRMITRLCNDGLLKRENSAGDRRIVKVYITEKGLQKIKDIESYNYDVISAQFSRIPAEEIRTLMNSIERLDEFLGLQTSRKE